MIYNFSKHFLDEFMVSLLLLVFSLQIMGPKQSYMNQFVAKDSILRYTKLAAQERPIRTLPAGTEETACG